MGSEQTTHEPGATGSAQALALVLDSLAAFQRGDMPAVVAHWSPAIRWHLSGRSRFAGSYEGPDAVLGYFQRAMEMSEGTLRPELLSSAASEAGAALVLGTRARRDGRSLDVREVLLFHVRDRSIVEVYQIAFDQYAWDEFWG
jgi:ketosteroid isomerase-like protein